MKKVLTLVELSIALVIISLLIGVLFVGQSLIGSCKITASISQIRQYDAAVAQFK